MRENRFKSDTNADSSNNKKDGSPFNDEFDGLGVVNKMNNNLVGTVNTFQSDSSLIIPPDFSNLLLISICFRVFDFIHEFIFVSIHFLFPDFRPIYSISQFNMLILCRMYLRTI